MTTSNERIEALLSPDKGEGEAGNKDNHKWWWHRFKMNPLRDKQFWYAVSVAALLGIILLFALSTYSTNTEKAEEDQLTRIETLCRVQSQEDLDVATGHLILAFGDLANALNEGLPRDSPERVQVDTDLKFWTAEVKRATGVRDTAVVKCAELVGRTVPSTIAANPIPTNSNS